MEVRRSSGEHGVMTAQTSASRIARILRTVALGSARDLRLLDDREIVRTPVERPGSGERLQGSDCD